MPVGLIGFGRVGRRVASYLKAFGASVGYYDPNVDAASADVVRYESLAALLAASRVVVLAASHRAGDPPILDRDAVLALSGNYFVNIARGELVDEEALLAALRKGALAGCAVDVIRDETGANNRSAWLEATAALNVIVTPHIAGATYRSMKATEEFIAEKLIAAVNADVAASTRVGT
jgi:D-3-phosphoglycerate dehydrogenase